MVVNPYAAPTSTLVEPGVDGAKLQRIARDHKCCVISFSISVCTVISAACSAANIPLFNTPILLALMSLVTPLALVTCAIFTVMLIFRLNGIIGGIMLLGCLFVPFFNFLIFLLILNDAAKKLKKHGYRVGFWGGIKEQPIVGSPVAAPFST